VFPIPFRATRPLAVIGRPEVVLVMPSSTLARKSISFDRPMVRMFKAQVMGMKRNEKEVAKHQTETSSAMWKKMKYENKR
jgi:hypothetical protein